MTDHDLLPSPPFNSSQKINKHIKNKAETAFSVFSCYCYYIML